MVYDPCRSQPSVDMWRPGLRFFRLVVFFVFFYGFSMVFHLFFVFFGLFLLLQTSPVDFFQTPSLGREEFLLQRSRKSQETSRILFSFKHFAGPKFFAAKRFFCSSKEKSGVFLGVFLCVVVVGKDSDRFFLGILQCVHRAVFRVGRNVKQLLAQDFLELKRRHHLLGPVNIVG